jgi:hypothetical protein
MTNDQLTKPKRSRKLPLVLLAILALSISFFFWNDRFQSSFAGLGALLAIPAALGGLIAYVANVDGKTSAMGCFVWPTLALLALVGTAWLALGEGFLCIAMVLPLWIPAAITGYAVSWWNTSNPKPHDNADPSRLYSIAWTVLPLLLVVAEQFHPPDWQNISVSRDIEIKASSAVIWPLLVSIPDISPNEGRSNFSQDILGVPRPREAILVHQKGSLVRKAHWGDGVRFEEQIDYIKPLASISWKFLFPNKSIEKHIDQHISPNSDLLKIKSGRYELIRISPTVTRVRLTTEYAMRTRLIGYLTWWGERLLGDIQGNVLEIVRDRAEANVRLET